LPVSEGQEAEAYRAEEDIHEDKRDKAQWTALLLAKDHLESLTKRFAVICGEFSELS